VNCKDEYGNTPLHLACEYEQVDIVRLLTLEKCCSQSIQNSNALQTCLLAAVQVSLVLAELTRKLVINESPLHVKVQCGFSERGFLKSSLREDKVLGMMGLVA